MKCYKLWPLRVNVRQKKCRIFTKENIFCNIIQMCWLELYSLWSLGNTAGALSKDFLSTWDKTCNIYWTIISSMCGWQLKLIKLLADANTQLILLLCRSHSLLCTFLHPPVSYFHVSPNTFLSILFSNIIILRSFPSSDTSHFTPTQGD